MKRREFVKFVGAAAFLNTSTLSAGQEKKHSWEFEADVAEACGCAIPCPCNFGRRTKNKCEGSRLIQLTSGNINGKDLTDISFVATFHMGQWTRIYIDETLSSESRAAFDQLLETAFKGFKKLSHIIEYTPLLVEREPDTVFFTVPESTVKIALLPGLDGKPISVNGLPNIAFYEYTQYESVIHKHTSTSGEFSHSGTNGFTSRMIFAGSA
mgnify:CR=1 FL=1